MFRPFWPCIPLLGVSSGCHSGPRALLGFSWNSRGLSSLLVLGFCFSPFCFAASHFFLEGPPMARPTAGPGRSTSRPLARVRARGSPSTGGGLVPSSSFFFFCCPFCMAEGHRDPRTHSVRGLLLGRGRFYLPPQALFSHTHVFCFPYPRFFCLLFLFRIPRAVPRITRHSLGAPRIRRSPQPPSP